MGKAAVSGSGEFSLSTSQDSCSARTLAAGQHCTIAVQFAPTAAGNEAATLTVPSDAASGPLTVTLAGAGQTPPAAATPPAPPAPTVTVPTLPGGGLVLQEGPSAKQTALNVQMSAPGTLPSPSSKA